MLLKHRLGWLLCVWVCASAAYAEGAVSRIYAHKHIGMTTCSGAGCHDEAATPQGSLILNNEMEAWRSRDPHAGAYEILRKPESVRIAKNLGLSDPTAAKICLDCHADNVPAELRGEAFDITAGIGCEACHGGAERWRDTHFKDAGNRQADLDNGLYDTANPQSRAELCLSCHMGNKDRMITHEIMGAGHPRLSFELDSFTNFEPHWFIDDEYQQRKGVSKDGLRDWAVGQGVAARTLIEQFAQSEQKRTGMFPELVFFDCHACHKTMEPSRWSRRESAGLDPGVIRLNDSNLLIFRYVIEVVAPGQAGEFRNAIRQLHASTLQGQQATVSQANRVAALLDAAIPEAAGYAGFKDEFPRKVAAAMVRDAERGDFADYATAQQAYQALDSFVAADTTPEEIQNQTPHRLQGRLDRVLATLENEDGFNSAAFRDALRGFAN